MIRLGHKNLFSELRIIVLILNRFWRSSFIFLTLIHSGNLVNSIFELIFGFMQILIIWNIQSFLVCFLLLCNFWVTRNFNYASLLLLSLIFIFWRLYRCKKFFKHRKLLVFNFVFYVFWAGLQSLQVWKEILAFNRFSEDCLEWTL